MDSMPAAVHLFAVRRDLTGFQHVMPAPGEQTSWWALLNLTPGPWRVIVELQPQALNRPIMLGVDLTVRGDYRPEPLPPPADTVSIDGLQARMSGALTTRAGCAVRGHGHRGWRAGDRPAAVPRCTRPRGDHPPGDLALGTCTPRPSSGSGPRLEFEGGVPRARDVRGLRRVLSRRVDCTSRRTPSRCGDDRYVGAAAVGPAGRAGHDLCVLRGPDREEAQPAARA